MSQLWSQVHSPRRGHIHVQRGGAHEAHVGHFKPKWVFENRQLAAPVLPGVRSDLGQVQVALVLQRLAVER